MLLYGLIPEHIVNSGWSIIHYIRLIHFLSDRAFAGVHSYPVR